MKCPVCFATWPDSKGSLCPQCQFDQSAPNAKDTSVILAARESFKDKASAYAPDKRVSTWDVVKPWVGVVIAFIIFMLWLRACHTMGRTIF
jgi:hypothetical protein